jgi:DNA-binding FadR family transcriptional regulator
MQRGRLADAVVAELGAEIVCGRLVENTILPPETELCYRFQVSRTVIREAMARLAAVGFVRIHQGYGTVVLGRDSWRDLSPEVIRIRTDNGLVGDVAADLLEGRRIIEVEIAGLAARRRSDEQLAQLTVLLRRMEQCEDDPLAYTEADVEFHDGLLVACGNVILQQIMRPLNQLRRVGSLLTAYQDQSRQRFAAAMTTHQAILDALASQDPSAARKAMALHITQFEHDLLDVLGEGGPPQSH